MKTPIEIHGFLLDHCGGDGSENYKQALAWITAALDEARAEGMREGIEEARLAVHGAEHHDDERCRFDSCKRLRALLAPGAEVVEKEV